MARRRTFRNRWRTETITRYISANPTKDLQFLPDQHSLWLLTYIMENLTKYPDSGESYPLVHWHMDLAITEGVIN